MDDHRWDQTNAKQQFVQHRKLSRSSKKCVDNYFDESRVEKEYVDNQFDESRQSKKCADNNFTALSRENFAEVVVGGQEVKVGQEDVVVEKAASCGRRG